MSDLKTRAESLRDKAAKYRIHALLFAFGTTAAACGSAAEIAAGHDTTLGVFLGGIAVIGAAAYGLELSEVSEASQRATALEAVYEVDQLQVAREAVERRDRSSV